jgi:hypothetical protein
MINSVDAVIVFWTTNSSKSGFVNQEIGFAVDRKPIIVLKDPDVSLTGYVYGYDIIDMEPETGREQAEKLRASLQQKKSSKEFVNMVISGILGFALGAGLVLLLAKSR